jgi:hypothetical protein
LTRDEIEKLLADNFLPPDNAVLEKNALIINTGDQLILFDTGHGRLEALWADDGQAIEQYETGWG